MISRRHIECFCAASQRQLSPLTVESDEMVRSVWRHPLALSAWFILAVYFVNSVWPSALADTLRLLGMLALMTVLLLRAHEANRRAVITRREAALTLLQSTPTLLQFLGWYFHYPVTVGVFGMVVVGTLPDLFGSDSTNRWLGIAFALPFLLLLGAIPWTIAIHRDLTRRAKDGRCLRCGYAAIPGMPCSECGNVLGRAGGAGFNPATASAS